MYKTVDQAHFPRVRAQLPPLPHPRRQTKALLGVASHYPGVYFANSSGALPDATSSWPPAQPMLYDCELCVTRNGFMALEVDEI